MEKERLIERLNYVMGKKEVLTLAEIFTEMEDGISILWNLCQCSNEKLSFHSAWVLENVLIPNPELFSLNFSKIIELLPTTKSPSLQRHLCKLLSYAMENCSRNKLPNDACLLFKEMNMEPIVEVCFEWLLNPLVKPSVKAYCMDILFHLSKRYDWITNELPHIIELQMIDGTPGVKAKGNIVIKRLKKEF